MHESPSPAPQPVDDDPFVFTPVLMQRNRRDGWTPRRQHDFIQALAVSGSVHRAAQAVGKTRQSAYALLNRPGAEEFARAWDAAAAMGYDQQYDRAVERVLHGVTSPRFYKGKQVGTRHHFDYRLVAAVLGAKGPPPRNKVAK
jgi:hypothetical protein